jgi:long-chain acyl-CoA synthetase
LEIEAEPIYFSYLPLSHLAERQVIEFTALCRGAPVSFNEGLEFLGRDMQRTRPTFFFGAPRVWEQFQQAVLAQFGGADAFNRALLADSQVVSENVKAALGLDRCEFHLTGSAPLPMPLMAWWDSVGIALMEGFGQTEAMSLIISREGQRRLGALGKPLPGVDIKITQAGELAIRADGCTPGYYKQPDKTAELIQDGWLHTGDRFRQDEDGFLYITGRIKDYFKTIHGKFVAPTPIEALFAKNTCVEQQCLLGLGMAKTVMVAVVSESMRATPLEDIEASVTSTIRSMNASLEKHERLAGVVLTYAPWTIESGILTPTLKIKRDQIADRFGDVAAAMATESAEKKQILVRWC